MPVLLWVKNAVLVYLTIFSFKRSIARVLVGIEPKKLREMMSCFELVPHTGEKHFKPRPLNRILLSLGGSFQNFRRAPSLGSEEHYRSKLFLVLMYILI